MNRKLKKCCFSDLKTKNKKQITEFIKNNLDVSVLDNNLSNGDVLDVFYTKAEEGLFE